MTEGDIFMIVMQAVAGPIYGWALYRHADIPGTRYNDPLGKTTLGLLCGFTLSMIAFHVAMVAEGKNTIWFQLANVFGLSWLLFFLFCSILRLGLGEYLTIKRGEQWAKEIEYFYLTLASLGIVGTLTKLSPSAHQLEFLDYISPSIFSLAIVLRYLKTKVEIATWNKLSFYEQQKALVEAEQREIARIMSDFKIAGLRREREILVNEIEEIAKRKITPPAPATGTSET